MKNLSLLFTFVVLYSTSFTQDINSYVDDFQNIVRQVPLEIHISERCDYFIKELDRSSDEMGDILKNPVNIDVEDLRLLKSTKIRAEALEDFLRAVGNSSNNSVFITQAQLNRVKEVLTLQMTEKFSNEFCCSIFEVTFNDYICLLALKKGSNESYNVKCVIASNSGRVVTKMDMGLLTNNYRKLWSNSDHIGSKNYKILSINCTSLGPSLF